MKISELTERYKKMPSPLKASLWFVVCGILKDVIDVIMTPLFTRILTKEQYGYFNVYNSWFQVFKILFALNLFGDVFNVGLSRYEKDRDRFVSTTLGLITCMTSGYLIVSLFFKEWLSAIIRLPYEMILLYFIHVVVYSAYYCWIRRERYDFNYRNVVSVSFLYILFQPLSAVFAILCINSSIDPGHLRIIASVGVQIIIGIILYIGMMLKGRKFFDRYKWAYSLKTGLQLLPFSFSKVVLNQSDRIMINYYSGSADTAVFSVAHSAAFTMQVVTEALNGAFVPWLYRKIRKNETEGVKNVAIFMLTLIAVCVLGIDMVAPEMISILGNSGYHEGLYCIPSLAFSVYLIFVYTMFANVELYYGKNIYVTVISVIGMLTNVILNAIFIGRYGFIAAGYTTMASYMIICVGHYLALRKCLYDRQVMIDELFDIRKIVLLTVFLLILTLLSVYLYESMVIRISIIAAVAGILFMMRNRLWGLYNDLKGEQNDG